MTKAITSAQDFLAAIAQKTEVFELDGVTVELRSLGYGEVQEILTKYENNPTEQMFQFTLRGIAAPKVEESALRKAPLPFIVGIGKRVGQISGTAQEPNSPLDGDGS